MSISRRHFIKIGTLAAIGSVFGDFGRMVWAQGLQLIDMAMKKRTDEANKKAVPIAKGLNYVEDLDKALKAKTIKKSEVKSPDGRTFAANQQRCDNCIFFDMQKKKVDTCSLIPGVLVHKPGSCNNWAAQPKKA